MEPVDPFKRFCYSRAPPRAAKRRNQGKEGIYEGACKGIFWAKVNATSGYIEGFCVDDAPYFSELGDPPATEALRLVIRLIGDYVELLLTLAEGRNLADTSGHIQAFAQNIFALTSLASGPGAAAGLTSVLGALEPIIRDAAQRKNIEEMKRLVLSGAPLLKKLIETLREATAEVFNTLIFNSVQGATSPEAMDDKRVAETFILRIDGVSDRHVQLRDAARRAGTQLRSTDDGVSTTAKRGVNSSVCTTFRRAIG